MRCPQCSKEAPAESVVCPFCATPLDEAPTSAEAPESIPDDAPTSLDVAAATPAEAPTSAASVPNADPMSLSDSGQHGRFLPGTMVAERYRVVGLLGRGGMGEVYRADDLKLGQQVALKFLSRRAAADAEQIRRLLDEVRMARKVSHPNVCRVWDIGEADGHHYVSMEYVDGEDLASLLRRIGRLPKDKAVEIARQLCAALASAHDEGVLHRDLKPANIMLDGRGRVKLTDFGLAGVAEVRAGTPIYMAPEQLSGEEVSVRSDVYALGLVLHELFTGKRVFDADSFDELSRQHQDSLTRTLTSTTELDPAIDRVISRCLDADPAKRPASALVVAAGFPGADPLAAALAAGETPSPEMVAEAGGEGSLSFKVALPLLLVAIVAALAVGILQSRRSLVGWVPFDTPPILLEARAQEILAELGYDDEFTDSASGFATDTAYLDWLEESEAAAERWDTVAAGRPPIVYFWWRSSPQVMVPRPNPPASSVSVGENDPSRTTPGMQFIRLDTTGRLIHLEVVPGRTAAPGDAAISVDWTPLFEAADLDATAFTAVVPRRTPRVFADERVAWEGVFPEDPETALRIEAAAFEGRPVLFVLVAAFDPAFDPPEPTASGSSPGLSALGLAQLGVIVAFLALILTAIFGGLYVAQRNVRSGRGDPRGARRLGFAIASAYAVAWILGEHTFFFDDFNLFVNMVINATAAGGFGWALYLAVEPFMRRHSPEALIGWTRLIDGRLNDPLVGRDILLGCLAGAVGRLIDIFPFALAGRQGAGGSNFEFIPEPSVARILGQTIEMAAGIVIVGLAVSFLYGLSFVALRRRHWLAYLGWLALFGGMGFVPGLTVNNYSPAETWLTSTMWGVGWALWLFVLFRLGMVVYLIMGATGFLLMTTLPTLDFSAWYASSMIGGLVIFSVILGYGFYRCVGWRGSIADSLVGD